MWRTMSVAAVFMGLAFVLTPAVQAEITFPLAAPAGGYDVPAPGTLQVLIRDDLKGDYMKIDDGPITAPHLGDPYLRNVSPIQIVAQADEGTGALENLNLVAIISTAKLLQIDDTVFDFSAGDWVWSPTPMDMNSPSRVTFDGEVAALMHSNRLAVFPMVFGTAPMVFDTQVFVTAGGDYSDMLVEYVDGTAAGVQILPTVIPEPGTLAILLSGLMGSALLLWTRRR